MFFNKTIEEVLKELEVKSNNRTFSKGNRTKKRKIWTKSIRS